MSRSKSLRLLAVILLPAIAACLVEAAPSPIYGPAPVFGPPPPPAGTSARPPAPYDLPQTGGGVTPAPPLLVPPPVSPPASPPRRPAPRPPKPGWYTFASREYGFQIAYPEIYLVYTQARNLLPSSPQLLSVSRFRERTGGGLTSATVFLVEVFPAENRMGLKPWLDKYRLLNAQSEIAALQVPGADEALKVREDRDRPAFRYYRQGGLIFRLSPGGQFGEEMVDSFKLPPPKPKTE